MVPLVIGENLLRCSGPGSPPERQAWLADLPATVESLTRRWSLRLGEPFQPGGDCSWVAPARDEAGRDLVLKVGWRHVEAQHEAEGLTLWAGNGAVLVHRAETVDETSALLLERCLPGNTLKRTLPEPEQDVIVAGLLRRLWREPPPGHPFRSLRAMCDQWVVEAEEASFPDSFDPGLVRAGLALMRELPRSADRELVLATDLHGDNILAAGREPWLVIDPKPHVGDPTYDASQHMLNCLGRLSTDPFGLVQRLAGLLDLNAERLRLWAFARCVEGSHSWPELWPAAVALAPA